MPISVFKGWGRFQAEFFLTGHAQYGQQKGRISHCAIANVLVFAAQEEFFPQRGRQGKSQGHRAPHRLTGSQNCKVRLCYRGRTWLQSDGLLFPALLWPFHRCWWSLLPDHGFKPLRKGA